MPLENIRIIDICNKSELDWVTGGEEAVEEIAPKSVSAFQEAQHAFTARDYRRARGIFQKLDKKYPDQIVFLNGLALSSFAAGEEDADTYIAKIEDLDEAIYHYLRGLEDEIAGNYLGAIAHYEEALKIREDFTPALFRLALYLDLRGYDDEALVLYEKTLQQNPLYANVLLNLGLMYEDSNNYIKAIECYSKILKKNPRHKRAKLYLKDAQSSISMYVDEEKEREQDKQNQILATPISDFELSVRSKNCLSKMKIKTLGDLIKKTESELLSYKNFGETSLAEIKEILAKKGLRLGMGREEEGVSKKKERKIAKPVRLPSNQEVMSIPIGNLELSVRSRKCLTGLGVKTVGELTERSEKELLGCKNFGNTSMLEIKQKLAELGISLRDG